MKTLKENAGYMTVEASMVVTVMILTIMVILYSFMLLYQNVIIQHAATTAAQEGARMISSEVEGRSVYDFYTRPTTDDLVAIENIAKDVLKKSMIKANVCKINVEKVDLGFLWSNGISVTIVEEVNIPILGIFKKYNLIDVGKFESTAIAEIASPQETIRNVDLGMDVVKKGIGIAKSAISGAIGRLITGKVTGN